MQLSSRTRFLLAEMLGCAKLEVTPEAVTGLRWQDFRRHVGVGPVSRREITDWMREAGYEWVRHLQEWQRRPDSVVQELPSIPHRTMTERLREYHTDEVDRINLLADAIEYIEQQWEEIQRLENELTDLRAQRQETRTGEQ